MKNMALIVLTLGILVVLFVALKPKAEVPSSTQRTDITSLSPTMQTFTLVVKNKKLVSGPAVIQVKEGDTVIIKITADVDEELHLHGYDKSVDLEANKEGELSFTADLTGRFEYELEQSKTAIGVLEVQPR